MQKRVPMWLIIILVCSLTCIKAFKIVTSHAEPGVEKYKSVSFSIQPDYVGELNWTNTNLRVTYDFGDLTTYKTITFDGSIPIARVDHIFEREGTFAVKAYLHTPSYSLSSFASKQTQDFFLVANATSWSSKTVLVEHGDCYKFSMYSSVTRGSSKNVFSSASYVLVSGQAISTYEIFIGLDASATTAKEFITLGEYPSIIAEPTILHMKTYVIDVKGPVQTLASEGLWKVLVNVSSELSSLKFTVSSNGASRLGCAIQSSTFHMNTFAKNKEPSNSVPLVTAPFVGDGSSTPFLNIFTTDACDPSIVIGYHLKNTIPTEGVSSSALLSYDGFQSSSIYNMSWGFSSDEYIKYVQLLDSKILILTNKGLYKDEIWNSDGSLNNNLQRLIDSKYLQASTQIMDVRVSSHCPKVFSESSQDRTREQGMYVHLANSILYTDDWTQDNTTFVPLLIPTSFVVFSAIRDVVRGHHLILVRDSSSIESIAILTDEGSWKLLYSFPSGSGLSSLSYDPDGTTVYAYGSTLWSSSNGGLALWHKHFLFGDEGSRELKFMTFSSHREFALTDKNYNVHYGKIGIHKKQLILDSMDQPTLDSNIFSYGIFFDALGCIKSMTLRKDGASPSLSTIPVKSLIDSTNLKLSNITIVTKGTLGNTKIGSWFSGTRDIAGSFSESLIGMTIKMHNGGTVMVTSIDSTGAFAYGKVTHSIPKCISTCSSVINKEMNISIGSGDSAYICLGSGWTSDYVGMSVKFRISTIFIEQYLNSSCVRGWYFEKELDSGSFFNIEAGSWFIIDTRPKYMKASNLIATITTSATFAPSSGIMEVHFSKSQNFMTGQILVKSTDTVSIGISSTDYWAWILEPINSSSYLIFSRNGFASGQSFSSVDGVFVTNTTQSSPYSSFPLIQTIWDFIFAECDFTYFAATENGLHVIDNEDTFYFGSSIQYRDNLIPNDRSGLRLTVLNKYLLNTTIFVDTNSIFKHTKGLEQTISRSYLFNENSPHVGKLDVVVGPRGRSDVGSSVLVVDYPNAVLKCPPFSHVAQIDTSCPSTKDLYLEYPTNASMQKLSVNYRPPSYRGRGYPMSPHVYNADPTVTTGFLEGTKAVFKQCVVSNGKSVCGCTPKQRLSPFIADSECTESAMRWYFGKSYVPDLKIRQEGRESLRLNLSYVIYDLNNRTDYCFNHTPHLCTTYSTEEEKRNVLSGIVINPNKMTIHENGYSSLSPDAIDFQGDGLYHFYVEVIGNDTRCKLTTEFKVYIFEPPLEQNVEFTAFSTTIMICIAILFFFAATSDPRHLPYRKHKYD